MIARVAGAFLWLFLPSLLPATALIGTVPAVVPLAILLTSLVASLAGMLALPTASSVLTWFLILAASANLAALLLLVRRRPAGPTRSQLFAGALIVLTSAIPLVNLRRPPIDWDARSIWLLHARWFFAGGDYLREALSNKAFDFSHSDYPPVIPATVGAMWRFIGRIDLLTGQTVIALLNVSAVALLGLAFVQLGVNRSLLAGLPAGILASVGAVGIAGAGATNGLADLLWAAGAAAGVVYLLVARPNRENLTLGTVLMMIAGLTKNEGLAAALVILVLACLRHRARPGLLGIFAASGGFCLAWPILARVYGANSDLSGVGARFISGELAIPLRFGATVDALIPLLAQVALGAVICALIGLMFFKEAREILKLGSEVWSWLAIIGTTSVIVLAYVVSPQDIAWQLGTSISRTTVSIRLLLLCEILVWFVICAERLQLLRRTVDRLQIQPDSRQ